MYTADSLFNLTAYPFPEIILFAGGCLLWVVAYAIIIHNGVKHQMIEMPVFAACSNFAWEFAWGTVFQTDMGQFLVWTYRAWLILDIFIFYMVIRYGAKLVTTPLIKRHFKPLTIVTMLGMLVLYYLFTKGGFDTPIGANSAYICQLFISALYVVLVLQLPSMKGFSVAVAWLRTVGTAMNTVYMLLHYPDNHFLHALGIFAFVLDISYIILFRLRRQNRILINLPERAIEAV